MNIKDVIRSARGLCSEEVIVLRDTLFTNRGVKDRSNFPSKMGKVLMKAVNVRGGENSILAKVTSSTRKNVYIEDLVLAEHSDIAKKVQKDFEKFETFCWVEEYREPLTKRTYFKISCCAKTFCGARFSVCKDLMHVYTNTVRGIESVDSLFNCAMKWQELIPDEETDLDAETTGFYHAIEVMLPWLLRGAQFNLLREKYKKTSSCDLTIAKAFLIPERVVKHICECSEGGNDLPYCGFSYQINSALDRE